MALFCESCESMSRIYSSLSRFEEVDSARRCIVALRQYSDLHPSFAKVSITLILIHPLTPSQTQKIPQGSTEDAFAKRLERLSLFDNSSSFLAANTSQSVAARSAPVFSPVDTNPVEDAWRARVASAPVVMQGAPSTGRPKFGGARPSLETVLEDPSVMLEVQADVFVQG
jgi:hypothetical protein